jgi:hypothetical protein
LEKVSLRPLRQPTPTSCGQTCLAIVAELPVTQIQRLIRKRGRTTPKDIEYGLELIGRRDVRRVKLAAGDALPAPCIALLRGKDVAHWVVFDGESVLDPHRGWRARLDGYQRFVVSGRGWRFQLAITWRDSRTDV